MKILMLAPTPYFSDRGCHVRIFEEARVLQTLGHDVRIFTYHLGRDLDPIPTHRIPTIPWYKKESAGPSWHKPYLDLLLFFSAFRGGRRFRPDIIHAHLHEGAFVGFFLKKLLGVPLVFDCQGSLTAELIDHDFVRENSVLYKLFYAIERRINRWADHILTSSTPTAGLLCERFGLPKDKVTPVVDGVDTQHFRPGMATEALRKSIGIPDKKKVLVFLGALTEYQGVDLLLEVAARLDSRRDDFHLLLMGYPTERYVEKAEGMGISHRVTFTGRIDYGLAAAYLDLGDVAVSPKLAQTEANGKLFNYMACGLPTVVFDTPVNREILGDTGVYAGYGDAEDFARKVEVLLDNPVRRDALSGQALTRAEREHSWVARGGDLVEIYRRLCPTP